MGEPPLPPFLDILMSPSRWEIQGPTDGATFVPCFRPYFGYIFPEQYALYMVGTSNKSVPVAWPLNGQDCWALFWKVSVFDPSERLKHAVHTLQMTILMGIMGKNALGTRGTQFSDKSIWWLNSPRGHWVILGLLLNTTKVLSPHRLGYKHVLVGGAITILENMSQWEGWHFFISMCCRGVPARSCTLAWRYSVQRMVQL